MQPFTGLPADPDAEFTGVVAVKVENSPQARPQTGLEDADIVFVEMVEGGQTRFMALYNSQFPEVVGPVRSLRSTDAGILGQWAGNATLFYSGGQPQFEAKVRNAGVELHVDGVHDGFFRDRNRVRPHNLYQSLADTVGAFDPAETCPTPLFEYRTDDSPAGPAAVGSVSTAQVNFPGVNSTWTWDVETGVWLRADQGRENTSAATGDQLGAVNVVVLHVTFHNLSERDASGAPVPETELVGEGALDYFVGGEQFSGSWAKASESEPFEFYDADGDPLLLAPGNTWVELLTNTGSLTVR